MTDSPALVERFWAVVQARDWTAFGALLADGVVYEMPQTRERVRGREAYVRFNAEYPGDWRIRLDRVVGAGQQAASWIEFTLDGVPVPGITFFDLDADGRIEHITEFWPEPYEPPPGREHLVERY
jgi:hypothetical protein